jgi:hypothetical protein
MNKVPEINCPLRKLKEIWEKWNSIYFTITASTDIREASPSGSCNLHRINPYTYKKIEHWNFSSLISMAKWSKYIKLGEILEYVQIKDWSTEALLPTPQYEQRVIM